MANQISTHNNEEDRQNWQHRQFRRRHTTDSCKLGLTTLQLCHGHEPSWAVVSRLYLFTIGLLCPSFCKPSWPFCWGSVIKCFDSRMLLVWAWCSMLRLSFNSDGSICKAFTVSFAAHPSMPVIKLRLVHQLYYWFLFMTDAWWFHYSKLSFIIVW